MTLTHRGYLLRLEHRIFSCDALGRNLWVLYRENGRRVRLSGRGPHTLSFDTQARALLAVEALADVETTATGPATHAAFIERFQQLQDEADIAAGRAPFWAGLKQARASGQLQRKPPSLSH